MLIDRRGTQILPQSQRIQLFTLRLSLTKTRSLIRLLMLGLVSPMGVHRLQNLLEERQLSPEPL